eukprot:SAG31_NODE_1704_length_7492_cov_49.815231_3_plen_287_part_00
MKRAALPHGQTWDNHLVVREILRVAVVAEVRREEHVRVEPAQKANHSPATAMHPRWGGRCSADRPTRLREDRDEVLESAQEEYLERLAVEDEAVAELVHPIDRKVRLAAVCAIIMGCLSDIRSAKVLSAGCSKMVWSGPALQIRVNSRQSHGLPLAWKCSASPNQVKSMASQPPPIFRPSQSERWSTSFLAWVARRAKHRQPERQPHEGTLWAGAAIEHAGTRLFGERGAVPVDVELVALLRRPHAHRRLQLDRARAAFPSQEYPPPPLLRAPAAAFRRQSLARLL